MYNFISSYRCDRRRIFCISRLWFFAAVTHFSAHRSARSILNMDPSDEGSATARCKKHRDDMEYWLMHVYDPSVDVLDAEQQARPVLHLKEKDAKNDEDENGALGTIGTRGKLVVKRLKRSSGGCGMKKLLDFVDWYGRSVYVFNDIGSLEKVDAEVGQSKI